MVESVHSGDVAVCDAAGRLIAFAGEPDRPVYARSCMKPLQAAVSLSFAPLSFTDTEVAVMCASHNAEPVHLEAVRSVLDRSGVPETSLQCPPARPWDEESAALAPGRLRINSDCSGKHAGMLAACRCMGWPEETYREAEHPLQQAVSRSVGAVAGAGSLATGVDGCGVPVHGLPLRSMATLYARLAAGRVPGELEQEVARAVGAMRRQPYLVAGRNRVDTAVMEKAPMVIVKGGAEGLVCAGLLEAGVGVAVKIRDGSSRAAGPALIRVLGRLHAIEEVAASKLGPFARPAVLGGGRPVGEMVAEFPLETDRA